MTTHAPVPAPLKKRRAAKGITALVALGAGIALALIAFTLTQTGSASTSPNDEVNDGDVTVTDLSLDDVQQGTTPVDGVGDPDPFDFTFTNTADEAAGITLDDITRQGEYSADQQAFYDSLLVSLQAEGAEAPFYTGPLSGLESAGPTYVGDVPADGTLEIDVKASTTVSTTSADPLDIDFTIDYQVGPVGGTTPPAESQCAPLADTPLFEPCQQFEAALGGLAGGEPSEPSNPDEGEASQCDAFAQAGTEAVTACKAILEALGIEGGEGGGDEGESQCAAFADLGEQAVGACQQFLQAIGVEEAPEDPDGGDTETPDCPPATGPLSGQIQSVIDQLAANDPSGQGTPLFDALEQVNCQVIVALEAAGAEQGIPPEGFPPAP